MRLFVGVELDARVRAELALRVPPRAAGVSAPPGLRWLPPHNWHFTLQFLGHVEDARVPQLAQACARAAGARAAFALELAGAGAFPSSRRARVVWIGVSRGHEPLAALAQAVYTHTEPLGFEREAREFRAHLTVARFKQPANAQALLAALDVPALRSRVHELTLFRSQLSSKGAEYEALARFPLG